MSGAERARFEAHQRRWYFGTDVKRDHEWERMLPDLRRSARWENDYRLWQAATAAARATITEGVCKEAYERGVAEERERCARTAEDAIKIWAGEERANALCLRIATAIRARTPSPACETCGHGRDWHKDGDPVGACYIPPTAHSGPCRCKAFVLRPACETSSEEEK